MEYKRLTKRIGKDNIPCLIGDFYDELEEADFAISALAVLEDMIEDGLLIERYFINRDELPNGKIWYNVCELNERYASIKRQCETREQAEARLKEFIGE